MDTSVLRLPDGPVDLTAIDPAGTPGHEGGKAKATLAEVGEELADLQERLYAKAQAVWAEREAADIDP